MTYLDHNATSPLLPEALERMMPWLGVPANPSSVHRAGQRAASAVDVAREQVAALVGGHPAGVVFTSGATEANHTFLRGLVGIRRAAISSIEHPCVHAAAATLARRGVEIVSIPCDPDGVVRHRTSDADVVSIMAANHETGVIQDIPEAGSAPWIHVDATQAAGRIPLALGHVHGVVLSSHKLGGPGGVGALVLRDGQPFPPLLSGGSQERGRRAGTVYTAGVVGFGAACAIALRELTQRRARWLVQSTRLRHGLRALGARLVGAPERLLPNTTCVVFPGVRGETLVQALDLAGVCASSGAACASGSLDPSPVLLAMGDPEPAGGVRFSLGPDTRDEAIERVLTVLPGLLSLLKEP